MNVPLAPTSLDAERAVLGGVLLDFAQLDELADVLAPADFFAESHARLWEFCLSQRARGMALDVLGLADHLLGLGDDVERWGGLAYLPSLPELVPTTEHLGYYAQLVKRSARRRAYLALAQGLMRRVSEGGEPEALAEFTERELLRLTADVGERGLRPVSSLLTEEWAKLEAAADRPCEITGVPTGLADLDAWTAGLQAGDLVVLAARPSMGKTALAMQIAAHAGLIRRIPTAVFSLEMGGGQLVRRMLASSAGVDTQAMRTGNVSRREGWPALERASEPYHGAPLWIDDTPGISLGALRSQARRWKARHGLRLVVIDYLQLMSGDHGLPREQQVASISRGLKVLAKELDAPILVLSQLNRGVEARGDKRPLISDLRESGAIEQDADVVAMLYRDSYYNTDAESPGETEIIFAKHRNGATGTVKVHFEPRFTRFTPLERRHI